MTLGLYIGVLLWPPVMNYNKPISEKVTQVCLKEIHNHPLKDLLKKRGHLTYAKHGAKAHSSICDPRLTGKGNSKIQIFYYYSTNVSDPCHQAILSFASYTLAYHLKTIWLFTLSDLKTIVVPQTAFAIASVLSGGVLTLNESPHVTAVLGRVPMTLFWTWINLLPFAINNQRQPDSIIEDGQNKPWRSMPSKRLSGRQAKHVMLFTYFVALASSLKLGGLRQCLILIVLGYWYNDLGGADYSCIIRNFINACGILSFATGAAEVASASKMFTTPFHSVAWQWFLIVGAIIFSSVQSQDMYDQAGDSLRKRNTVPLVIGDLFARWTIAIPVALWSYICPAFWQLGIGSRGLVLLVGAVIVLRTLSMKTVAQDKTTFRIWNLWMILCYSLPLIKKLQKA